MVRFLLVFLAFILYSLIVIVVWVKVSAYIPQLVHQSTKAVLATKTVTKSLHKKPTSKYSHTNPTPTINVK